MKTLAYLATILALLLFLAPGGIQAKENGTVRLAPDDEKEEEGKKDEGGSKFGEDEPKEEKKDIPDKPTPETYILKDYKLEMTAEDGRFWKQNLNFTKEDEEKGVCLRMILKLPKTKQLWDAQIFCQAWAHNMNLEFEDGTKMNTAEIKRLSEKWFEDAERDRKGFSDPVKPKTIRLSRDTGKVQMWAFSTSDGVPTRQFFYLFKFDQKTYYFVVTYTTASAKDKKLVKSIQKMLKTIREHKRGR
jgi:hypothetical protein